MAKRRRQQYRSLGVVVAVLIALVGWGANQLGVLQQKGEAGTTIQAPAASGVQAKLEGLDYTNDSAPVVTVDHNQSGLNMRQWQGPQIIYGNLDSINRTTTNTGYLNKQTLIHSAGRPSQQFEPTGWHNRYSLVDGKRVNRQNRGHLIAYTLSGNLDADGKFQQGELGSSDNPKNLATQTEYANQVLMQPYEQQVRDAIANGQKVIYKVTTIFRGDELMPRGYWLRAKSDGNLDFNVYIFNVQAGIKYDYATGRSVVDQSVKVPQQ